MLTRLLCVCAVVRIGVAHPVNATAVAQLVEPGQGGAQYTVKEIGSGWFFDTCGLVFTCEHVRRACRKAIANVSGAKLVVCSCADECAAVDWQLYSWEAKVLAHTRHWDSTMATPEETEPATENVTSMSAPSDAAVLLVTKHMHTGNPVSNPVTMPVSGEEITALAVGNSTTLKNGERLFVLGFPQMGGATSTPTKADFAGTFIDDHGNWLKVNALIAGGHSGGPAIGQPRDVQERGTRGLVFGWNVRKQMHDVVAGMCHLRPIEAGRACMDAARVKLAQQPPPLSLPLSSPLPSPLPSPPPSPPPAPSDSLPPSPLPSSLPPPPSSPQPLPLPSGRGVEAAVAQLSIESSLATSTTDAPPLMPLPLPLFNDATRTGHAPLLPARLSHSLPASRPQSLPRSAGPSPTPTPLPQPSNLRPLNLPSPPPSHPPSPPSFESDLATELSSLDIRHTSADAPITAGESCELVAQRIASLAPAYARYADIIRENAIDVATLREAETNEELDELILGLGIAKLHKSKVRACFKELRQQARSGVAVGSETSRQQTRATPRVLITAAAQSALSQQHLPNVEPEARLVHAAFGGDALLLLDASFESVDNALEGREVWFFAGHGDAKLCGERVPAFMFGSGMESVSISALAEMARKHVERGSLKLVVFTGCQTLQLGLAMRRVGLVECVSCWETAFSDEAGPAFGSAFARAIANGKTPQEAQDDACAALVAVREPGSLDSGHFASVQKFELDVDPSDARRVHQSGPKVGRLIQLNGVHARVAAGVPTLLDSRAPLQAALPLGMPGEDTVKQCIRRDADVDAVVASLTGAKPTTALLGLRGMGGVGKTMLAAAVLSEASVREHYRDGVLWLNVGLNGHKRLHALLRQAADDLHSLLVMRFGARDPADRSLDANGLAVWMASKVRHRRMLCVLDDVWEPEVTQAFAPTSVQLLVTTRQAAVAATVGGDVIDVDTVDGETARRMLARAAVHEVDALPKEADAVLEACCGLPLALSMAGAIIKHGGTWASMLAEWKAAYSAQPHDETILQPDARQDWSLQAMVKVSVDRLRPKLQVAYRGLALAPKRLPLIDDLLSALVGCPDAATRHEWTEALADHSLLQIAQDGTCMAHDLQMDYLKQMGPPTDARERLLAWLTSHNVIARFDSLEQCSNAAGGSLGTFMLSVAALWRELCGAEGAAEEAGRAYLACLKDASGVGIARLQACAGGLLYAMGSFAAGEQLLQLAVQKKRATVGNTHPDTLTSLSTLALLLHDQGDLAGAELLQREALAGLRTTLGDTHRDTLASLSNLGNLLRAQGDLAGAESLQREALAGLRTTLGGTHPGTLTSLGKLGSLQRAQGDLAGAEPLLREALAGRRATLGDTHPGTLTSLSNLGSLLRAQGDLAGAESLQREALAGRRATLGNTHPDTLTSLRNLALLLQAKHDFVGAHAMFLEALIIASRAFGPRHVMTVHLTRDLQCVITAGRRAGNPIQQQKPNEKCRCGAGIKFKKCCGKPS